MTPPLARSGEPPEQGKHESGTVPAPRHQGPRPRGFWRRHARPGRVGHPGNRGVPLHLSESVIERIGMLSADELARWLRDMLACCAAGSARTCSTSRSIRASRAGAESLESGAVPDGRHAPHAAPPAGARACPPALLEGKLVPWLVELGSVAEFESLLAPLVSSRTSLSEVDAADVAWFIRQYRGDVFRLLPGTCRSARSARWLAARWSSTWRAMRGWTNSWIATSRPRPTRCGWRWP